VTRSTLGLSALPLLLVTLIASGCGKKGAPLPPLLRIPSAVGEASVMRFNDEVIVRFTVPTSNADGNQPADIQRVETYAITLERAPSANLPPERLRRAATLLHSEPVRRPVVPTAPLAESESAPKPAPAEAGVDQGATIIVRETITSDASVATALEEISSPERVSEVEPLPGPLIAPTELPAPMRYYFAVGVGRNGRYGPIQAILPVPLGVTSSAPAPPELSHDVTTLTIKWAPSSDARGVTPPPLPDVLPSKPTQPTPEPTTYDVFEVPAGNATPSMPVALTQAPVFEQQLTAPVGAFGVERCFMVRPVDILQGLHVRGPASPTVCITPKDTYPPPPPQSLAAVAIEGAIRLIWEPSDSADLAGYLVLRARLPDDTLTPTTPEPTTGTTFEDKGVREGVTYAYVVVAVDKAGNRSEPSNRVEETARQ
jgi:hypothetical protein